jgi:hypothetical protein
LAIRLRGMPSTCHGMRCPTPPRVARNRNVQPSLEEVLELRRDRMSTVGPVIEGLTDESLDGHSEPVEGPGWPESRSYPVREPAGRPERRVGAPAVRRTGPGSPRGAQLVAVPLDLPAELIGYLA